MLLEKALEKYILDNYGVSISAINTTVDRKTVLALFIYLFEGMEDIDIDKKITIDMHVDSFVLRTETKIEEETVKGLTSMFSDKKFEVVEGYIKAANVYNYTIGFLNPIALLCILPLLDRDKFKGFIKKDVSNKFQNLLQKSNSNYPETLREMDSEITKILKTFEQSNSYSALIKEELSKLKMFIVGEKAKEYKEHVTYIKNEIKQYQDEIARQYNKLHKLELKILGCISIENELDDCINDLIEIIDFTDGLSIVNINSVGLGFVVDGYFSIWKDEYLKLALEKLNSCNNCFMHTVMESSDCTEEVARQIYRLIFEKRRIKIKVHQEYILRYTEDRVYPNSREATESGVCNTHIGHYGCWAESESIIGAYLHEYRYADAIMQTVNSTYNLNLLDGAVMERLASDLFSTSYKVLVDDKTNEEMTIMELIEKVDKGEYDEEF